MTAIVSVGLPVFNGADYLAASIDSILSQEYTNLELIISDNASTDGTQTIIREAAARDGRVRPHFSRTNMGAAWNFNYVLEVSRGRYFRWAGHDDLILPGFLDTCVGVLSAAPDDNILCYTKSYLTDAEGDVLIEYEDRMHLQDDLPSDRLSAYLRNVRLVNFFFGLWKRSALIATRRLGAYAAADIVLIAELAMAGKFIEVPDRLFVRRRHPDASWLAVGKYERFADWFDPTRDHRLVFPTWRISRELLRGVRLAGVSSAERRRLYRAVLLDYSLRKKGALLRELLRVPQVMVHSLSSRDSSIG